MKWPTNMKFSIHFILVSLSTVFWGFGNIYSQSASITDSTMMKITRVAKEIMEEAGTCALITIDQEGRPRVRTMDPFAPDTNFVVWFGTNPYSRKVKQIERDSRVTLYYTAENESGYVMIHGKARLVNSQEEKKKRWKEEWGDFYPDKKEGYMLIKVSPEWMEVISITHNILGDDKSWEPTIVKFDTQE